MDVDNETFDQMMGAEFPEGIEEPKEVRIGAISAERRMAFWTLEALTQIVAQFHLDPEMVVAIAEEFPAYVMIQGESLHYYLASERDKGGQFAVYDALDSLTPLSTALCAAFVGWMQEHGLARHIHCWVHLTGEGFASATIGLDGVDGAPTLYLAISTG